MQNVKKLCNCILSASLMMSASLFPTFAEVQDGITITGNSSATIMGYQTEIPEGYSVSVTWGAMSFVFDKGTYVPLTGQLGRTTEALSYTGVEAGQTDGALQRWYGFDGSNNKVEVTNLSTGNVTLGASVAKSDAETAASGEEVFTLYFPGTYKDSDHALSAENTYETFTVNHDNTGNDALTMYKKTATPAAITGVNLAAHGRDNTGALTTTVDTEKFGFYLNITGAPSASFSTDASTPGTIGVITLNFTVPSQQQEP